MKSLLTTLSLALLTFGAMAQKSPTDYVNPFIGTSNFGVTQPGPFVPGGMVSMSPMNTIAHADHKINTDGWCSTPFVWENRWMIGFTQVNLSGVGCPDFGSLLLMPTTGATVVDFDKYASTMSGSLARAGYFSTTIDKYGVKAEMSATKRSTISRYTFPAGRSNILFNIGQGLTTECGGYAKIVSHSEIEGFKTLGDFCYGRPQSVVPVYFVVRTNKPAQKVNYWKKQRELPKAVGAWSSTSGQYKIYDRTTMPIAGDDIGVAFSFATAEQEQIEVSVGISYVSVENARANLDAEQGGRNFEAIYADACSQWNKVLEVVALEGGSEDQKTQFYTALYHNWVHPNVLQDANGDYPEMGTGRTRRMAQGQDRLTMFSGWDVYRLTPFFGALFFPERQAEMARSMMQMYSESGNLPKFEIAAQDFMVMEGDAALPYMTACYFLGLTKGIDPEILYQAMLKNAMGQSPVRGNQEFYEKNHFIPLRTRFDNSVSQALELYMADWSLAQIALQLGKKADYEMLMERAMGYKIYFDKSYGLMRPVLENGTFMEGFNPREGENFAPSNGFHEGTSWNYSFSVPYDIQGLIKLFGSPKRFVDSLTSCFENGYFDMSNEPDMGYPYYFSYVKGSEWLTQKWVKECLTKYFSNTPAGLPGNDDAGTMSAWQNLSMMGIYPPCPARAEYVITTPSFDKVTIKLDGSFYNRKELVIEAINRSDENIYIERIELDGKAYKSRFISHEKLTNAGRLTIYCTNKH